MISSFEEMRAKLPMQFRLGSFAVGYFVDYTCDSVDDLKSIPENGFCSVLFDVKVKNGI